MMTRAVSQLLSVPLLALAMSSANSAAYEFGSDVRTQYSYSNNWLFDENNPIGAVRNGVKLGLDLHRESELNRLSLLLEGERNEHDDNRISDVDRYSATLEFLRRKAYGGTTFTAKHLNQDTLFSAFDADGIFATDERQLIQQLTLSEYRELGERSFAWLTLNWQDVEFEGDNLDSGRDDFRSSRVMLGLSRQQRANLRWSFSMALDQIVREGFFLTAAGPFLLLGDAETESLLWGPSMELEADHNARWRSGLTLSARRRVDDTSTRTLFGSQESERRSDDYFGQIWVQRSGERGSLKLQIDRSFRPAPNGTVQIINRDAVELSLQRRLSERWNASLVLLAFRDDQEAEVESLSFRRDGRQAELALAWSVSRRLALTANARYQSQQQDSDIAQQNLDVSRYWVGLGLSYRLGSISQ